MIKTLELSWITCLWHVEFYGISRVLFYRDSYIMPVLWVLMKFNIQCQLYVWKEKTFLGWTCNYHVIDINFHIIEVQSCQRHEILCKQSAEAMTWKFACQRRANTLKVKKFINSLILCEQSDKSMTWQKIILSTFQSLLLTSSSSSSLCIIWASSLLHLLIRRLREI